jgi:hypothetical protein
MVTELLVDVLPLLLVPLQLPTFQPEEGLAVSWITAPAVYWPEGQPVELPGKAEGLPPEPV